MRLHRALDGDAELPFAFWLGRLCEEFPCYGPEEAYRAWLRAPAGLLESIVEARVYAREKAHYESLTDKKKAPDTPTMRLVKEITGELHLESLKAFQQEQADAEIDGSAL